MSPFIVFIFALSAFFALAYVMYNRLGRLSDPNAPYSKIVKAVLGVCVLLPIIGFALYLHRTRGVIGQNTHAFSLSAGAQSALDKLRAEARNFPDGSIDRARDFALLGQMELRLGQDEQAALDWQSALDAAFNPQLAYSLAALRTNLRGYSDQADTDLIRRALDSGDVKAPWRISAENLLARAEHDRDRVNQEGFSGFEDLAS